MTTRDEIGKKEEDDDDGDDNNSVDSSDFRSRNNDACDHYLF
jgi:hypothetical protein